MGWGSGLPKMVEGEAELEEGEAAYDDGRNIDLERLSYLDEKVQSVLGHFQKDFEGGVSAENLGAKFGGYGSFLPTYQRSPAIWSQPKSPQRAQAYSSTRSPAYLRRQGPAQNATVPDALSQRNGTCSGHTSHDMMVPSGDGSVRQDSFLASAQVAEKFPKRHQQAPNRSLIPNDQKPLKFRIKVGSDKIAQKNAAIYSGLGLTSPSSSTGNSLGESEGNLFGSQEIPDGSLSSILQIMTSVIVSGDQFVSPLHDSFLGLASNISKESKPGVIVKLKKSHSATSAEDSVSRLRDEDVMTRKQTEVGKSEISKKSKFDNGKAFEDDIQPRLKDRSGAQILENKQCVSFDVTDKRLSEPIDNMDESSKDSAKAVETFGEYDNGALSSKRHSSKAKMNGRFSGNEKVKNEPLESMPDQNGGNFEHREAKSRFLQLGKKKQILSAQKGALVDHNEGDNGISVGERDCKGDMDHLIQKPSMKATSNEQDAARIPDTAKKVLSESKKNSKRPQVKGKVSLDSAQESRSAAAVKEKWMKKDARKADDTHKDMLKTNLESRSKGVDMLEDPSGNRLKESNLDTVKEMNARDKLKEKPSYKKSENQVTSGGLLKNPPPDGFPPNMGLTLGGGQATEAPVLIEQWVGCDSCQKWRLLPYGTLSEHLPEKWSCSMLNWLPGMNNCVISEEETTKAVQALSQLPLPENPLGFQIRADKPTIGVYPVDQHLINHTNQNCRFDYMDNGRKKTHKTKGIVVPVSKAKNFQQDVVKKGSSKDRKQSLMGVNHINKLSSQDFSEPEIALKERSDRQKNDHIPRGYTKPKRKVKREADEDDHKVQKRTKIESAFDIDNFQTSSANPGRLGFSSSTVSITMPSTKNSQKHSENDFSKDLKVDERNGLQTSARKAKEGSSGLPGSGSSDMVRKSNDMEIPSKKRKLKDWQQQQQQQQHYLETLPSDRSHLHDRNAPVKEESSDSGFRGDKKPQVSRTVGKDSCRSKSNADLKRKDTATRMLPSASKNIIDGNFDSLKQPNKYRVKIASQLTMEDLESLKKDLGCDPVSTAATSSSSKVSDSRKTRSSFQEMKGSPAESVSSSPMRVSNMNKLSPKNDVFGFDDFKVGDFSTNRSPRKFVAGDVNHVSKRPGMAKKRKNSEVSEPESADNPLLDLSEVDAGDKFRGESNVAVKPSTFFGNSVDNSLDIWEGHSPCPTDTRASELCKDRVGKNQHNIHHRSGKASSLSKDKEGNFIGALEPVSDLRNDPGVLNAKRSSRVETGIVQSHASGCSVFKSDAKQPFFDQSVIKSVKISRHAVKEPRKLLDENREDHMQPEEKGRSGMKLGDLGKKDASVLRQHGAINDFGAQVAKKISMREDCRNGKSMVDRHSEVEHEMLPSASKLAPGTPNGSLLPIHTNDVSACNDVSKLSKDLGHAIHQNEPRQIMGNSAPDRSVLRDPSGPSLLRRDTSCQAASLVLKEAEGLRGYADHLKDSGFGFESNETYFQAALKFLHGASFLENSSENTKSGEFSQMQIYISTAKLCETCAGEYERRQEMAAAALAYKCIEVAYMRVIYCKSSSVSRHWHDLQGSLRNVPQGESPSSSASDIDNLNNQAVAEKAPLSKSNGSLVWNHVIAPQNRPNFVQLLDFTQDVNSAIEASKKSRNAFAAANLILEETQNKEGIVALKRVIDFSFQDVEEFARLVKIAAEAISRQGFGSSRD